MHNNSAEINAKYLVLVIFSRLLNMLDDIEISHIKNVCSLFIFITISLCSFYE